MFFFFLVFSPQRNNDSAKGLRGDQHPRNTVRDLSRFQQPWSVLPSHRLSIHIQDQSSDPSQHGPRPDARLMEPRQARVPRLPQRSRGGASERAVLERAHGDSLRRHYLPTGLLRWVSLFGRDSPADQGLALDGSEEGRVYRDDSFRDLALARSHCFFHGVSPDLGWSLYVYFYTAVYSDAQGFHVGLLHV